MKFLIISSAPLKQVSDPLLRTGFSKLQLPFYQQFITQTSHWRLSHLEANRKVFRRSLRKPPRKLKTQNRFRPRRVHFASFSAPSTSASRYGIFPSTTLVI